MNRLGRSSLPLRPRVCLLCQTRTTIPSITSTLSPLTGWQAIRGIGRRPERRGKKSRHALSSNVSRTSLAPRASRERKGPWGGTNITQVPEELASRSRTRDSRGASRGDRDPRKDGGKDKGSKPESPLYKALKMQTALAPVSYAQRTKVKERIAEITSFDHFPLISVVHHSISSQALPGLTDLMPTPIQRVAIPELLKDPLPPLGAPPSSDPKYEQYLLAAETGSGKTLAYLIPLLDNFKRLEAAEAAHEKKEEEAKQREKERELKTKNRAFDIAPEEPPLSNAARPRMVILVPTSELAFQVGDKLKAFSHTVKFRSAVLASNLTPRRIKNGLFNEKGVDIIVTTPHLLASIAEKEPYVLSRVNYMVLDEADSLLDKSFSPILNEIISKATPSLHKLVLCSATIPRGMDATLRKRWPDIKRLTTPSLHAIPRRVQLGVIDVQKPPYNGNRSLACADIIWSIGKAGDSGGDDLGPGQARSQDKRILVFVNRREDATEVAQFLKSKGIDAKAFTRDVTDRKEREILAPFTDWAPPMTAAQVLEAMETEKKRRREDRSIPFVNAGGDPYAGPPPEKRLENVQVLVSTDIASRGVDTLAVKTVVLYDVPRTTIDFIHRLGRLGRMGKRGRAVVLVGKNDRKDVVKEVREAMFRGQALI
ncbi:ATP-dependent RNA helicase MRH4 [Aspergillus fijiensis CBS 313.89]|uniref:RNA helicase n=1 Tax=Aspergillus fijiensis CBS 313.89 TaxID=1448319 RepID=A0A8G1RZ33_9EURO|nr:P-loop containing nucleoside triphosphate hydrolase protein [Aspergillus fijiensis CBS 313.89]RAK81658.1 P-loop containing nucleoside triphosphate hydrolase protein [Aspergillus fijiensis CBS 313.89]